MGVVAGDNGEVFGSSRWDRRRPTPELRLPPTVPRNEDGPARMLLHFAQGEPREAYFEGLARGLASMSDAERDAFMAEHDNVWVD